MFVFFFLALSKISLLISVSTNPCPTRYLVLKYLLYLQSVDYAGNDYQKRK